MQIGELHFITCGSVLISYVKRLALNLNNFRKGMNFMAELKIELTKTPKTKPTDDSKLGFGGIFTDHMFLMNYDEGEGWHDARLPD